MTREADLLMILDYSLDVKVPTGKPKTNSNKEYFKQQSYSKWACAELYDYVLCHNNIPVVEAIENFAAKMNDYSCIDPETSWIFSVAYDTTLSILQEFYAIH